MKSSVYCVRNCLRQLVAWLDMDAAEADEEVDVSFCKTVEPGYEVLRIKVQSASSACQIDIPRSS
jgi:hypothetical protein